MWKNICHTKKKIVKSESVSLLLELATSSVGNILYARVENMASARYVTCLTTSGKRKGSAEKARFEMTSFLS